MEVLLWIWSPIISIFFIFYGFLHQIKVSHPKNAIPDSYLCIYSYLLNNLKMGILQAHIFYKRIGPLASGCQPQASLRNLHDNNWYYTQPNSICLSRAPFFWPLRDHTQASRVWTHAYGNFLSFTKVSKQWTMTTRTKLTFDYMSATNAMSCSYYPRKPMNCR